MLPDITGSQKSKMAADTREVIIFQLTELFDIWTETLLFSFLKKNKKPSSHH